MDAGTSGYAHRSDSRCRPIREDDGTVAAEVIPAEGVATLEAAVILGVVAVTPEVVNPVAANPEDGAPAKNKINLRPPMT